MSAADIVTFKNLAVVMIIAVAFLSGLELGRAFSFWKW